MAKIVLPVRTTYTTSLLNEQPKHLPIKQTLQDKELEKKVKVASLTGSAITTLLYLLALAKGTNKKAFKIKDMLNVDFDSTIRTIGLATSALIGGLGGGLLFDNKKSQKPKLKEAMHQFLGNIITPITIVGIATSQIKKQNYSMWKSALLGGVAALFGVGLGVTGGNKIASIVNEKIFKEDDTRKVGVKDFGIHVDDILVVMGMTDLGAAVKSFVSKALPAIFLICGYEAGTKRVQEKN